MLVIADVRPFGKVRRFVSVVFTAVPQVDEHLRRAVVHHGRVGRHRRKEAEDGYRLLFVCTGNICRSPFAEILTPHLLRGCLGGRVEQAFTVSSAGVQAVVGSAMHPDSRAELKPWNLHGNHADRFVARQLSSVIIEQSDLILGATPRHRSAVVTHCPAALPITFTVREFARLAAAVDPGQLPAHPVARAHALVQLAPLQRALVPADPDGDNVPDPMGGPPMAHHQAAELIYSAVAAVVDVVASSKSS
jgi:protein-tyrosine phosphatase